MHTLGIPEEGEPKEPYRNYFVTSSHHNPYLEALEALEALGLMRQVPAPGWLADEDALWQATDEGIQWASKWQAERWSQVSHGKRRYREWLKTSDLDPDLTFGEWLQRDLYKRP